jgi:hypothetical protein
MLVPLIPQSLVLLRWTIFRTFLLLLLSPACRNPQNLTNGNQSLEKEQCYEKEFANIYIHHRFYVCSYLQCGKYLPHNFTVTYFDAKTGQLQRSDMFTDSYEKKWGVWYPTSRRIIHAQDGKLTTRIVEIRNIRAKSPGEQAARQENEKLFK